MKKKALPAVAVAAALAGSMAIAAQAEVNTNVFDMKEVSSRGLIANEPQSAHEGHDATTEEHEEEAKDADHKCAGGACGGKKEEHQESMHEKPATQEAEEHTPEHH